MYEAIEGYAEVKALMPVAFKPFEHVALRRMIDRFEEEGGELVISIPRPPTAAPGALRAGGVAGLAA